MNVQQAKDIAKKWVEQEAANLPGFIGAYLTGSILQELGSEIVPACSDIDIFVVIDSDQPPEKYGKFVYDDALLEVNFIATAALADVEKILSDYHLAGAFAVPSVLLDPTGKLAAIQRDVSAEFSKPDWIIKRCNDARHRANNFLENFRTTPHLHDQVTSLFFAAGVTTHILLVAACANPTIRRRYVACRAVLDRHKQLALHEQLLTTLGSTTLTKKQVMVHVDALGNCFDLACSLLSSPYQFAQDMTQETRAAAIDGSMEMIEAGYHREAIFWIIAIFSRCRAVTFADGTPHQLEQFDQKYWALLNTLGISNRQDMERRASHIETDIDLCWQTAQQIVAAE